MIFSGKNFIFFLSKTAFFFLSLFAGVASAEINVTDDAGKPFRLDKPVNRIVSLAPFITELLFEVGAEKKILGTIEFSDYPIEARNIPRIGRHNALDVEAILAMKPDLLIAWRTGTPAAPLSQLKRLGLPVFYLEPVRLEDITKSLQILGKLTGNIEQAKYQSLKFARQLEKLRKTFQPGEQLDVFYQIWDKPLMSVNRQHLVSDVLRLCGGKNIFQNVSTVSFSVTRESVIARNPDVIFLSGQGSLERDWKSHWLHWKSLKAVKQGNLFQVNPDYMRHTSRILLGVKQVCEKLENARKKTGK